MWRLPEHEHRVYPSNPLVAVVAQLAFHPILRIEDEIASFQERVRNSFPLFESVLEKTVTFLPSGGVQEREEETFHFSRPAGDTKLVLGPRFLGLECERHMERAVLVREFELGVESLQAIFSAIQPRRLALKYQNLINRSAIFGTENSNQDWTRLVNREFLAVPRDLADLQGTRTFHQIASPMTRGEMLITYGLVTPSESETTVFRVDFDRSMALNELRDLAGALEGFALDIYRAFVEVAGPDLLVWMEGSPPK